MSILVTLKTKAISAVQAAWDGLSKAVTLVHSEAETIVHDLPDITTELAALKSKFQDAGLTISAITISVERVSEVVAAVATATGEPAVAAEAVAVDVAAEAVNKETQVVEKAVDQSIGTGNQS